MMDNGFMNAVEIKKQLNLKVETDNRTLNKYVIQGKLEVKPLSQKVKLYRLAGNHDASHDNLNDEEWVIA